MGDAALEFNYYPNFVPDRYFEETCALWRVLDEHSGNRTKPRTEEEAHRDFSLLQERVRAGQSVFLCALDGQKLVAMATMTLPLESKSRARIDDVARLEIPVYKGVGTVLMELFFWYAERRGGVSECTWTCDDKRRAGGTRVYRALPGVDWWPEGDTVRYVMKLPYRRV